MEDLKAKVIEVAKKILDKDEFNVPRLAQCRKMLDTILHAPRYTTPHGQKFNKEKSD